MGKLRRNRHESCRSNRKKLVWTSTQCHLQEVKQHAYAGLQVMASNSLSACQYDRYMSATDNQHCIYTYSKGGSGLLGLVLPPTTTLTAWCFCSNASNANSWQRSYMSWSIATFITSAVGHYICVICSSSTECVRIAHQFAEYYKSSSSLYPQCLVQ